MAMETREESSASFLWVSSWQVLISKLSIVITNGEEWISAKSHDTFFIWKESKLLCNDFSVLIRWQFLYCTSSRDVRSLLSQRMNQQILSFTINVHNACNLIQGQTVQLKYACNNTVCQLYHIKNIKVAKVSRH